MSPAAFAAGDIYPLSIRCSLFSIIYNRTAAYNDVSVIEHHGLPRGNGPLGFLKFYPDFPFPGLPDPAGLLLLLVTDPGMEPLSVRQMLAGD